MKQKLFLTVFGALLALTAVARDFTYTYEGQTITYTVIDEDAKTCKPKEGNYPNAGNIVSGELKLPEHPKDGNLEYTLTEIGVCSFSGNITSVIIPSTVGWILSCGFFYCNELKEVSFGYVGGDYNDFPMGIYEYVFYSCPKLETIILNTPTRFWYDHCFESCDALNKLVYNVVNCTQIDKESILPGTIESITLGNMVEVIPSGLFSGRNIQSISLPPSVTTIGNNAFSGCTSLSSIDLPDSVTTIGDGAFGGCTSLSSIDLPDSVTTIGDYAFHHCTSLTGFTIPRSLASIGSYVFTGCDNLKILNYEAENLEDWGYYQFDDSSIETVNIGHTVKYLPPLFSSCMTLKALNFNAEECSIVSSRYNSYFPTHLEEVNIGESVKNIPAYIFYGCENLKSIKLPKSIEKIGKYAFSLCEKLEAVEIGSIEDWLKIDFENEGSNPFVNGGKLLINGESIRRLTIPEGIERLNSYAFIGCKSLLTVTLPSSLKSLGVEVFVRCDGIQRFIFPTLESYLAINYDADGEYSDTTDFFTSGNEGKIYIGNVEFVKESLTEWTIPSTWTRIPNFAFYKYQNLEKIIIPESVTEIGVGSFIYCNSLRDVKLPNSLAKIGGYAFEMSGIKSIEFGNSIESIGIGAFDYCYMESVHIADLEKWSQVRFEYYESIPYGSSGSPVGKFSSNPITRSRSFSVGDSYEPLKHLCLNLENGSVSAGCFAGAENLETVKIEAQSIDEGAFYECTNLKDLYLDVDAIAEYAFAETPALTSVYCPRQEPPVAFDKSFGNYDGAHLYVPEGCVGRYENAENCWWNFLEISESDFADMDDIFDPDNITGIRLVTESEIDMSRPYDVYDLNGSRVADNMASLAKGIYLVRQGNLTKKTVVK